MQLADNLYNNGVNPNELFVDWEDTQTIAKTNMSGMFPEFIELI